MGEGVNSKYILALSVVCLTALFFTAMWTVDIGASMKNIECALGVTPFAEGLVTRNVEPTVVYHTGLLGLSAVWLVLAAMTIWTIGRCKDGI